jgi:hypothetical protein
LIWPFTLVRCILLYTTVEIALQWRSLSILTVLKLSSFHNACISKNCCRNESHMLSRYLDLLKNQFSRCSIVTNNTMSRYWIRTSDLLPTYPINRKCHIWKCYYSFFYSEETRPFNVIADDRNGVTCLVIDRQSYHEMIANELSRLKREESFKYPRKK